jgi:hypothetical protein
MITGIILPFSINSAILHAKLTARATEKSYLQIKQKISPFPSDKYYFGGYLFLYTVQKSTVRTYLEK